MALTALLDLITANATQQGSSDRITGSEMRAILTSIVNTIQGDIAYSSTIPFDKLVSKMTTLPLSGPVTFTKNTTGAVPGFGTILRVVGNGANTPDLTAFKKASTSGSYVATSGTVNVFLFVYDGTDYWYSVYQEAGTSSGNITPADPTDGTVNDSNGIDTFDFTYASGYTAVSDYEYTMDGGSTTAVLTEKPLIVGDVSKAAGQVGVRVKAATGRNASAWLFNAQPFTASGNINPLAPTNLVVDDTANTATWTLATGYAATDHEYRWRTGGVYTAWTAATANSVNVGNIAIAIGDFQVRVKAATGRNASPVLSNATAFTVGAATLTMVDANLSASGTLTAQPTNPLIWYPNDYPTNSASSSTATASKLQTGLSGLAWYKNVNEIGSALGASVGFSTSSEAGEANGTWQIIAYIGGSFNHIYYRDGSGSDVDSGVIGDVGDIIAIRRTISGGVATWTIEKSSDDGATFTVIKTLTYASNADHWGHWSAYGGARIPYPKTSNNFTA